MTQTRDDLRNIAIIAHVDHGKTTLVDGMLKQTNVFRDASQASQAGERIMDSNALERERGITILSKNTAVTWGDVKINIVDTPGHADFGGEVERVLNMVDGALLLIDAVEGPMPQTRFVLRKALELGLKMIVVINKVDRPHARLEEAVNETFDLFIELGATDEQADFPIVYAIGLTGQAGYDAESLEENLDALFDTIVEHIPPPSLNAEESKAKLLVTTLDYDNYKGQIGVGRVHSGVFTQGMSVVRIKPNGERVNGRIEYLFTYHNLERTETDTAAAGDIIAFAGLNEIGISDTIAYPTVEEPLPPITVEEPTVKMTFGVSTSPFSGREGKTGWGTSRRIRERLYNEVRTNVSLRIEDGGSADKFVVSGRGELHLGILIETMRREGFEFEVSKPEVIPKEDPETGKMLEPIEEVHIEVADDYSGTVMELMGSRGAEMTNMSSGNGMTHITYIIPTRFLIGFQSQYMRATSGMGQLHTLHHGYDVVKGSPPSRQFGSLIADQPGTVTAYALVSLQQRGAFFVSPGDEVYEGMVVGENIRSDDMSINVAKAKHLDNFRAKPSAVTSQLTPARVLSLDDCIEFLADDELLEVTPQSLRLRKRILNNEQRMKVQKAKKKLQEA